MRSGLTIVPSSEGLGDPTIKPSEVGGAWGAAYAVGTPISALVTGICCALAIEYFQQFPEDGTRIRGSVIVVVGTTIFGLFLAMDLTYVRLVKNQTPPGGFGDIPWQDDAVALICGICQLICSAYFAYSAYSVATRKKLCAVWYGLLMAVIFLSAFFRAFLGLAPTDWFDGAVLCPKLTFLWLICSLLLDFSIAVTLLGHLRAPPPTSVVDNSGLPLPSSHPNQNFPPIVQRPRAPLLSRLLTTILTSFSLTAILMFSLLILVLAMHGTEFDPRLPKATGIFTALRLLATPTYAVTFLYTLNRRNSRGGIFHSSMSNEQNLQLGVRETRNGPLPVQTTRTYNNHNQNVPLPSPNIKANWPTVFTVFPPPNNKRANAAGRKETLGQKLKSDLPAAFSLTARWVHSSASSRRILNKFKVPSSPAPKPPLPIHTAENQREVVYHTTRPPSNHSNRNISFYSQNDHRQSYNSSLVVPIYPGTAI